MQVCQSENPVWIYVRDSSEKLLFMGGNSVSGTSGINAASLDGIYWKTLCIRVCKLRSRPQSLVQGRACFVRARLCLSRIEWIDCSDYEQSVSVFLRYLKSTRAA